MNAVKVPDSHPAKDIFDIQLARVPDKQQAQIS